MLWISSSSWLICTILSQSPDRFFSESFFIIIILRLKWQDIMPSVGHSDQPLSLYRVSFCVNTSLIDFPLQDSFCIFLMSAPKFGKESRDIVSKSACIWFSKKSSEINSVADTSKPNSCFSISESQWANHMDKTHKKNNFFMECLAIIFPLIRKGTFGESSANYMPRPGQ